MLPLFLQTKPLRQKHWVLKNIDLLTLSFQNTATKDDPPLKGKQNIVTIPKVLLLIWYSWWYPRYVLGMLLMAWWPSENVFCCNYMMWIKLKVSLNLAKQMSKQQKQHDKSDNAHVLRNCSSTAFPTGRPQVLYKHAFSLHQLSEVEMTFHMLSLKCSDIWNSQISLWRNPTESAESNWCCRRTVSNQNTVKSLGRWLFDMKYPEGL